MKYVMVLWILHMGATEPLTQQYDIKSMQECTDAIKEMESIVPKDIGAVAIGIQCYKGHAPKNASEQEASK